MQAEITGELAFPGPFVRRQITFQPGHRLTLKHGWGSPRFGITRLGIYQGVANHTGLSLLPGQIAEVRALAPPAVEIKKITHLVYLVYSLGRLKARWIEQGRRQEAADWEALGGARMGVEPQDEAEWQAEDTPRFGAEPEEQGWQDDGPLRGIEFLDG